MTLSNRPLIFATPVRAFDTLLLVHRRAVDTLDSVYVSGDALAGAVEAQLATTLLKVDVNCEEDEERLEAKSAGSRPEAAECAVRADRSSSRNSLEY